MIPKKNKAIFIVKITDEIFLVVNPHIKNGLKLINLIQKNVLSSINNTSTIEEISNLNNLSIDQTKQIIEILTQKKFVSFDGNFIEYKPNNNSKTIGFWIHTTNTCNLNCSYCYIKTKKIEHMPNKTINCFYDNIIHTVKKHKLTNVKLRIAGGEPMYTLKSWKPILLKLKKELQENNCKLSGSFLTNLTILNQNIIDDIKELGMNIGVSMDGLREYHDKNRSFINGKGSFDKLNKNLDLLLKNNIKPFIMTVVSDENLDGLPDFTRWLIKRGLKFRFSIVNGGIIDYVKLKKTLNQCFTILEDEIKKGYSFSESFKLDNLSFLSPSYRNCGSGTRSGAIYINGDIYFCQTHFGKNKDLGNIFKEKDLLKLIKKGSIYLEGLKNECYNCKYFLICSGGCPAYRKDNKSYDCDFYKKIIPKIYYLLGKERLYKYKSLAK